MSAFTTDNITYVKINKHTYCFYNFIIKDLDIFSCIFIDKINDPHNILELSFDVPEKIIENVFHYLYNFSKILLFNNMTLKDGIQTVLFMKYLGVDVSKIESVIETITRNKYIDEFIVECKELTYTPELLQFVSICKDECKETFIFNEILLEISSLNFPIEFSIQTLKKIIISDIKEQRFELHGYSGTISFDIVSGIYKNYNINMQHTIQWQAISKNYTLDISVKYFVNNKEINNAIRCYQISFAGWGINLTETIALHIANLLLNIETL
jgi:hypothetical protein